MVFLFLVLIGLALAEIDDLLTLTNETFYDEIEKHGKVFVKFFAPWCGHCKRLAPAWEELAGTIPGVQVAEMDCTVEAHEQICSTYHVTGFPTLVLIEKSGAFMKYDDAREVENMRNWAIDMSGPASKEITEETKIKGKEISFILTGAEEADIEKWNEVMSQYKGTYGIYHTSANEYKGVGGEGKHIVISKIREELKVVDYNPETVSDVVKENSRLLVNELTPKNFSTFATDSEHLMWITFVKNTHDEVFDGEYNKLKAASLKCGENVNFSFINGTNFEGFTKNFGDMNTMPFSIILKPNDYLFYALPADADICQFVADVSEGKIEAEDVRARNKKNEEDQEAQ